MAVQNARYTRISRLEEDSTSSASLPLVVPDRWGPKSIRCRVVGVMAALNARNEPCFCANLLAVHLLLLIQNSYRML